MIILGIGNDIVQVKRIHDILKRHEKRFMERVFTKNEQEYCLRRKEPAIHFAGRFAAKEAIVKALGTGFSQGLNWLDFEIIPDEKGKPKVFLSSAAIALFGPINLMLTISHCTEYATAVAIYTNSEK